MSHGKTRREVVLVRACQRCERCGAPQYAVGQWQEDRFLLARAAPQQQFTLVYSTSRELADRLNREEKPEQPYIVIVLTVTPAADGADVSDYRALCQRCEGAQESSHSRLTRRAVQAVADLF